MAKKARNKNSISKDNIRNFAVAAVFALAALTVVGFFNLYDTVHSSKISVTGFVAGSQTYPGPCTDSDYSPNGAAESYVVAGTCVDTVGSFTDTCNGNVITEYRCSVIYQNGAWTTNYYCVSQNYVCNSGCSSGACVTGTTSSTSTSTASTTSSSSSTSSSTTTTTAASKTCTDSDGGLNYNIKGTVSWTNNGMSGSSADLCSAAIINGVYVANALREYYCTGTNDIDYQQYECPNGNSCSNGICASTTTTTSSSSTTTSATTSVASTSSTTTAPTTSTITSTSSITPTTDITSTTISDILSEFTSSTSSSSTTSAMSTTSTSASSIFSTTTTVCMEFDESCRADSLQQSSYSTSIQTSIPTSITSSTTSIPLTSSTTTALDLISETTTESTSIPEVPGMPVSTVLSGQMEFQKDIAVSKGWNLVSMPEGAIETGTCTSYNNWYIFYWDDQQNNFVSRQTAENSGRSLDSYTKYPIWMYSTENCILKYDVQKSTDLSSIQLKSGWNYMPILKSMSLKKLNEVKGTCNIQQAYGFDKSNQQWISVSTVSDLYDKDYAQYSTGASTSATDTIQKNALGYGLIVKVASACSLGQVTTGTVPKTPEVPSGASTSCANRCGTTVDDSTDYTCSCDKYCTSYSDCCSDYQSTCATATSIKNTSGTSCANRCGTTVDDSTTYECSCDKACDYYGDCCSDYATACPASQYQII